MDTLLKIGLVLILIYIPQSFGAHYNTTARIGGDTSLTCRLDSRGSFMVVFRSPTGAALSRDDQLLTSDHRFQVSNPRFNIWRLSIDGVKVQDAGNYTCTVYQADTEVEVLKHDLELTINYPPTIQAHSPDQSAVTGANISLFCHAVGPPHPIVIWTFKAFDNNDEQVLPSGQTLNLPYVEVNNAGVYTCSADNNEPPPASEDIKLDVEFTPVVTVPYRRIGQSLGMDTVVECSIHANPLTEVKWILPSGQEMREEDAKGRFTIEQRLIDTYKYKVELQVQGIEEPDLGDYRCSASNEYGENSAATKLIEILDDGARVQKPPSDTLSHVGDDVTLDCVVTDMSSRDALIWWRRPSIAGGEPEKIFASDSSQNSVLKSGGRALDEDKYEIVGFYSLKIKSVVMDDGGPYTCELVGRNNYTASLVVVDSLMCTNGSLQPLVEGQTADLTCSLPVAGTSQAWEMTWSHNSQMKGSIKEDTSNQLVQRLRFRPWASESGSYRCTVKNDELDFQEECESELHVLGTPSDRSCIFHCEIICKVDL